MQRAIGIIPSRYYSRRFPGKPLAKLGGKPLIARVVETAEQAQSLSAVYVATDDTRIAEVVQDYGGRAILTSPQHPTGTDRVAEAASKLQGSVIVNIQGDEPLLAPEIIDRVVDSLGQSDVYMSTACSLLQRSSDAANPDIVKVVIDKAGFAIYFSRSPIPYFRASTGNRSTMYRHIGVYGFKRDFLFKLASLERTPLEISESLEQLRAIENGFKIKTVVVEHDSVGVDSRDDLLKAEKTLNKRKN